jgi:hypothetical protein
MPAELSLTPEQHRALRHVAAMFKCVLRSYPHADVVEICCRASYRVPRAYDIYSRLLQSGRLGNLSTHEFVEAFAPRLEVA